MPWSESSLFEDPEFPANEVSAGPLKHVEVSVIEWKRPGEFVVSEGGNTPFTLFPEDGVDPGDVCQNSIGDCWLLSALSTLAMTPEWIHKAFESPVDDEGFPCLNDKGKYVIRLYDVLQKKFVSIAIDDRIPCTKNEAGSWTPIGLRIKSGAIWPALLEKAVAKFFGSYAAIEGGLPDWALTAFTGHVASSFFYNSNIAKHVWAEGHTGHKAVQGVESMLRELDVKATSKTVSTGMLFAEVRDWLQNTDHTFVIGACTQAGSDQTGIHGVALGHAYGVMGVYPLEQGFTLVKLRNPWGRGEWQGSWSDGNELWERYPEVAEEVGYEPGDDGEFFMCTEDFTQLFAQLHYVRLPVEEGEEDTPDEELKDWYGDDEDEDETEDEDEDGEDEDEDEDLLAEIEAAFDKFDMDGSGTLSEKELTRGLKSVGFSKKQIQEALEAVDEDGDGKVSYEEFKQWYIDSDIQIEADE